MRYPHPQQRRTKVGWGNRTFPLWAEVIEEEHLPWVSPVFHSVVWLILPMLGIPLGLVLSPRIAVALVVGLFLCPKVRRNSVAKRGRNSSFINHAP